MGKNIEEYGPLLQIGVLVVAVTYFTTAGNPTKHIRNDFFGGLEVKTKNVIGGSFSGNEIFVDLEYGRCYFEANGKPVKEYMAGLKDNGKGTAFSRFANGSECVYLERPR